MESLWLDIRFAARTLLKNSGITAIVVLTLSLGIGANTAIFSMVNAVLLRPLPVHDPEQIVAVAIQQQDAPIGSSGFSYPEFSDFRIQSAKTIDLFGSAMDLADLSVDERAEQIGVSFVSSNYFSALGVKPVLGHLILPHEAETFGEEPVLVLGHSYWQRRFGGDPSVLGRRVRVNGRVATIVGVVPKEFGGMYSVFEMDGYLPLGAIPSLESRPRYQVDRNSRQILAFGRLRPGATLTDAQGQVTVVSGRLSNEYPATDSGYTARIVPERLARPQPYANNGFLLIGTLFLVFAGLILLIACTNVMNILFTRAAARQPEMAVRAALGASRVRLVRHMLAEGFLLAILGALGGISLAQLATNLVRLIHVPNLSIRLDFSFDWRVYTCAIVAAAFAGLSSSLSPALRASRADVNRVLQDGARGGSQGKSRQRVYGDLVVAQVAFSLMLLIVAGLFVRSLSRAQEIYLGFEPSNVLNVITDTHDPGYDPSRSVSFYRELETRVRALPGVQSASLASSIPIGYFPSKSSVHIEGWSAIADQQVSPILLNRVEAGYFETMRVPLLRGRPFTDFDDLTSPMVAIVNQTMARKFWPYTDPIGKRFSMQSLSGPFLTVVGVTQDGKYTTITEDPQPYFYVPLKQNYVSRQVLQIRSAVPTESLGMQVQQQIRSFAGEVPILNVQTMKESLAGGTGFFTFRLIASLASLMGVIGLILAVIGVYGVVSFSVSQRTREIGIRSALGASPQSVFLLIFGRGFKLVAVGVLTGLAAA